MTVDQQIIDHQRIWLKSKGYSDELLRMPEQLNSFLSLLDKTILVADPASKKDIHWTQQLKGNFEDGRYQVAFDFQYQFNAVANKLYLHDFAASMFDCQKSFRPFDISELPKASEVFRILRKENMRIVNDHWERRKRLYNPHGHRPLGGPHR
jgi:hypothetical protein